MLSVPTTIEEDIIDASVEPQTKVDLKGLLLEQLSELVAGMGQKPFRARQLMGWIHGKGVDDLTAMTDLGKGFRSQLGEVAFVSRLTSLQRDESATGEAVKFQFALPGGERIESVLIVDQNRRTVCLSSQVGCPLDCKFCATGRMGFICNSEAGQIVDQFLQVAHFVEERGEKLTNVVMMGMGEPLLNYDNLVQAVRLIRLEYGPRVGGRKITISTAGYLPGIRRLAREGLNLGLAVSLNATSDELRERLMPINRKYKIAELLEASREYFELVGRRVTFEYILLDGLTDADEDALRLAELTRGFPCKINLIPYNELGEDTPFKRPKSARVQQFRRVLEDASPMAVTLRESRGRDIDAACGQLFQAPVEPQQKAADPAAR